MRQVTRVFGLTLSSPRQPGHAFLSLVYAQQRRQFIPQGAISAVAIAFVFVDLIGGMVVSCNRSANRTSAMPFKKPLVPRLFSMQTWNAVVRKGGGYFRRW
jgi:hypothetical protein